MITYHEVIFMNKTNILMYHCNPTWNEVTLTSNFFIPGGIHIGAEVLVHPDFVIDSILSIEEYIIQYRYELIWKIIVAKVTPTSKVSQFQTIYCTIHHVNTFLFYSAVPGLLLSVVLKTESVVLWELPVEFREAYLWFLSLPGEDDQSSTAHEDVLAPLPQPREICASQIGSVTLNGSWGVNAWDPSDHSGAPPKLWLISQQILRGYTTATQPALLSLYGHYVVLCSPTNWSEIIPINMKHERWKALIIH